ncbi:hypothetical protein PHISP_06332 [Aspergillus sp. HF37]|nr:hypothetical protein PHISP_06332 [Aspergillus sp. HF37]
MSLSYLGCWSLLVLLLEATPTVNSPQTVEVDLVFPRNDTYAPSAIMPVVFAVQNTDLAGVLIKSLSYTIFDTLTWSYYGFGGVGTVDLEQSNLSSSDPYFVFDIARELLATEGIWMLQWKVSGLNCSRSTDPPTFDGRGINDANAVWFTTKKGAPQPDLVAAATDPSACSERDHSALAYNVTDIVDIPNSSKFRKFDSCAVLSPQSPWPAPSPCQGQMSPAKASNISAAVTSSVCDDLDPLVSCPPKTNRAPRAMRFPGGEPLVAGSSWLAVGWLAYVFL